MNVRHAQVLRVASWRQCRHEFLFPFDAPQRFDINFEHQYPPYNVENPVAPSVLLRVRLTTASEVFVEVVGPIVSGTEKPRAAAHLLAPHPFHMFTQGACVLEGMFLDILKHLMFSTTLCRGICPTDNYVHRDNDAVVIVNNTVYDKQCAVAYGGQATRCDVCASTSLIPCTAQRVKSEKHAMRCWRMHSRNARLRSNPPIIEFSFHWPS